MDKYKTLLSSFLQIIDKCKSEKEAITQKNIFFKKNISPLYKEIKNISESEKSAFGSNLNNLKDQIMQIYEKKIISFNDELSSKNHQITADLSIETANFNKGSLSPISLISNKIINFFKKLDFSVVNGDEVTSIKYNFDFLNFSADHPGRQTSETFYLNDKFMLRAHNTASTAEQLHKNNKSKDLRVLTFGYVYRNDDDDATHSHQFNQIDLVWVREGLSVANLKWILETFFKYLYGQDTTVRYRLSYFPFTEPSFEVDVKCPNCKGKGCNICKQSGWLEILGAGMLHQNVLSSAGFKITTGIAAGVGIERLAMIKYGIADIRDLYTNDFRFLKQLNQESK